MRESDPDVIQLSNLQQQYQSIKPEIDRAVSSVLEKQHFILGENVAALEQEIARYCGVPHAVGVASGTDALILSLKAAGIEPGDEVIVPAFTFVATADSVSILGATPVFADVEPHTLNIDVAQLESKITRKTKAIIPVHIFGQPADMRQVLALANRYELTVIGDAAQALGAQYEQDSVLSYGHFGCISFFPSKNLGACGDGGMIVTHFAEQAEKLRSLRSHGSKIKYFHQIQGWNSRLDELQAAILRAKLPHLDQWNAMRRQKADVYTQTLSGIEDVVTPSLAPNRTHVFHQYTIQVPERDAVQEYLRKDGIQTAVHYPLPLHLQPMFRHLGYSPGDLPVAEAAAKRVLSLPLYPELTDEQIFRVSESIQFALQSVTESATQ